MNVVVTSDAATGDQTEKVDKLEDDQRKAA